MSGQTVQGTVAAGRTEGGSAATGPRILVTGSRTWDDVPAVRAAVASAMHDLMADPYPPAVVVHGGARGADSIAGVEAQRLGALVEVHPADWDQYGKRAGYVRNAEMVQAGADVCLAFIRDNSKGASMCADLARRAGIVVREYRR